MSDTRHTFGVENSIFASCMRCYHFIITITDGPSLPDEFVINDSVPLGFRVWSAEEAHMAMQ